MRFLYVHAVDAWLAINCVSKAEQVSGKHILALSSTPTSEQANEDTHTPQWGHSTDNKNTDDLSRSDSL